MVLSNSDLEAVHYNSITQHTLIGINIKLKNISKLNLKKVEEMRNKKSVRCNRKQSTDSYIIVKSWFSEKTNKNDKTGASGCLRWLASNS